MSRKSNNLDKKMIRVGITLLKAHGVSQLSVRAVTDKVGANLGMFSYHFGTKDKFILRVLGEIYQGFLADLQKSNDKANNLENVLFRIATFSRDNREILTAILSDVLSDDRITTNFLHKNFSNHFIVLSETLKSHLLSKKLVVGNPHHAVRFLIGAVAVPNILLEVYNRRTPKKELAETDEDLRKRTKAAIVGLEMVLCSKKT